LSQELQVSRRTIERTVFTAFRKTFQGLRKQILIERLTAIFASHPSVAIKQVSFDLGYNSPSAFARAVKCACGRSPEQLRSRIIGDLLSRRTQILAKEGLES